VPDPLVVHQPESSVDSRQARRRLQAHGFTTAEVARRYRVGEDRVRRWIRRGELEAINTADAGACKPRFIITVESLERFERGRSVAQPKPAPRRRRKPPMVDYFP